MLQAKKTDIGPVSCYIEAYHFLKDNYMLFWGMFFVAMLVAGALPIVLQGPMFCGMMIALIAKQRNQPYDFGMLFKGFDHFMPSLIGSLMCFLVQIILTVPLIGIMIPGIFGGIYALENENYLWAGIGFSAYAIGLLLNISVGLILSSLIWFTCGLIIDRNLDGMAAFQLAWSAVWKNKVQLFLHSLVGVAISVVCIMMCYLPLLFVFPILMTAEYIAYVKIFGLSEEKPVLVENVAVVE